MVKNTYKRITALGLVFSLCAPCYFSFAQTPKEIGEDFLKMVTSIKIPRELLNQNRPNETAEGESNNTSREPLDQSWPSEAIEEDLPNISVELLNQPQPSTLERLWRDYGASTWLTICKQRFATAEEFRNRLRNTHENVPRGFLTALLCTLRFKLNLTAEEAEAMARDIIVEVYNLNKADAMRIVQELLPVAYNCYEQLSQRFSPSEYDIN